VDDAVSAAVKKRQTTIVRRHVAAEADEEKPINVCLFEISV